MDARVLIETLQRRRLGVALLGKTVKLTASREPDTDTKALIKELRERKAEIVSALTQPEPQIPVEQRYPLFREFHHRVVSETAQFDYLWLRENHPELYQTIKTKEDQIDALGAARLSEVMAIMREWSALVLNAYFEQRQSEKKRA